MTSGTALRKTIGTLLALHAIAISAAACTPGQATPTPTASNPWVTPLAENYLKAVTSNDPEGLRDLVAYVVGNPLPGSGNVVIGSHIPDSCLQAEIDGIIRAGVKPDSSIEIVSIGASDVEVEGSPANVSYAIETIQFGTRAGATIGRGVVEMTDGALVQMEPNESCDSLIEAEQ